MIEVMRDRTIALIDDFRRTILTSDWNYKLYNQPLWKHIYHALYWFDYWYCTPENFSKADFHTQNLHSLDIDSDVQISKEEMISYLDKVKNKTIVYLDNFDETMFEEICDGCEDKTRFACMLGQFPHVAFHLGNVNSITIKETGKWVYIPCRERDTDNGLFDE